MLINCSECGKQVSDKAACCPNCGNPIATAPNVVLPESGERQDRFFECIESIERIERELHERELNKSDKSRVVYVLLGLTLGWLGIHNFYAGRVGCGVCQIVLFALGLPLTAIFYIGFLLLVNLLVWIFVDICSVSTDAAGKKLN